MNLEDNGPSSSGNPLRGSLLGSVLSCRGSQAHVGLIRRSAAEMPRATVGKFVALKHGKGASVGMISEISAAASTGSMANCHAVAQVDLMGEITFAADGSIKFDRGVREYPAIGDEVELLGRDNLHLIYSSFSGQPLKIGEVQEDGGVPAYIDAEGLFTKHFAVLGSTGVGKSSGTAVILNELVNARPDVRVLLLDVHNEYSNSFGARSTVVDPDSLKLPFWLFNFEELTDAIYGGKPAVLEELDILAELIPLAKSSYSSIKSGAERSLLARRHPRQSGFTVDTPAPYMIQDLVSLIDDRMGKLENRATRMVHHRLMARIETIRNDPRYAFMFENANVGGDTMASVLGQLFAVNTNRTGVTLLKLAEFPGEVVDAVVCVVLRLAFEFGLWSDGGTPLLIVCEEAHRFAAADHSIGFAPARRALSRIAKEGRKYGVHLGLVTQRPAELDPTIVSQCSTLFMMRMSNERDHSLLRSAVADAASNLLLLVPSLGTGEVVGVGEAMPLPMRFSFRRLPRERLPSSDQLTNGMHLTDAERAANVEKAIDRWRRATSTPAGVPGEPMAPIPQEPSVQPDAAGGQNALTRGLQAALAGEGLLSRRNKF
ncbi:ATP-binding protein [Rhizobium sp. TH2]|uniref:ATP-binding protein n=1 Tax=Rhizobium sp. TH2 TaxID=2775403 RepID=UPI0021580234|nr:ATP-binding protein [Rhizobium sp. TH2]UVC07379.1 ATP-binding protein [Rhizobium sp. TH2]